MYICMYVCTLCRPHYHHYHHYHHHHQHHHHHHHHHQFLTSAIWQRLVQINDLHCSRSFVKSIAALNVIPTDSMSSCTLSFLRSVGLPLFLFHSVFACTPITMHVYVRACVCVYVCVCVDVCMDYVCMYDRKTSVVRCIALRCYLKHTKCNSDGKPERRWTTCYTVSL